MAKKNANYKLDTMSITVLLVMAIFGGLVGYHIGRASFANELGQFREAPMMLTTVGKMMEQKGTRYRDNELKQSGAMMVEKSSTMDMMMKSMIKGY